MTFGLGHLGTAHIAGRGSHLKAADPERYREVAQLSDAQEIGREALRLFRKGYQDEKGKGNRGDEGGDDGGGDGDGGKGEQLELAVGATVADNGKGRVHGLRHSRVW